MKALQDHRAAIGSGTGVGQVVERAIIFGATGGIGAALVAGLLERGISTVFAASRNKPEGLPAGARWVRFDLDNAGMGFDIALVDRRYRKGMGEFSISLSKACFDITVGIEHLRDDIRYVREEAVVAWMDKIWNRWMRVGAGISMHRRGVVLHGLDWVEDRGKLIIFNVDKRECFLGNIH